MPEHQAILELRRRIEQSGYVPVTALRGGCWCATGYAGNPREDIMAQGATEREALAQLALKAEAKPRNRLRAPTDSAPAALSAARIAESPPG